MMSEPDPDKIVRRYIRAKDRREPWLDNWRDCYEFALPQREGVIDGPNPGEKKGTRLYDATAADAVDQLAASLLSELTPPWSRWFAFLPGTKAPKGTEGEIAKVLENAAAVLQGHFDRSNFAVEMHQCYLDLVTAGTASLMFEEAPVGEQSAFRFTAVPLSDVVFEEGLNGALDTTYRRRELTAPQFRARYPDAPLPEKFEDADAEEADQKITVVEAVFPSERGFEYAAVRTENEGADADNQLITTGRFRTSPFINFRWQKAPGEIYGRSPVMKALPDIKTINKVVELVLKNASIAVTGIWQADDDGVLNPATIRLEPGTIIPKAVGSQGLTPLKPANDLNLSNMVLDQMRVRVRHAMMADMLGQPERPNMSATEVVTRSFEMARLLGATYGRLQSELLTPLALRAVAILQRRGEIPRFEIDGHVITLDYTSPLGRFRAKREAAQMAEWAGHVSSFGGSVAGLVDPVKAARHLAKAFGVPQDLMKSDEEIAALSAGGAPAPSGLPGGDGIMGSILDAINGDLPGLKIPKAGDGNGTV